MTMFRLKTFSCFIVACLLSPFLSACNFFEAATPVVPTTTVSIIYVTPTSALSSSVLPTSTEAATAISAAMPTLIANNLTGSDTMVYLRENPDTMSNIIALVSASSDIQAIGRTDDNQWIQVQFSGELTGWIIAGSIPASFDIGSLPVTGDAHNTPNVIILPPNLVQNLVLYQLPNEASMLELGSLSPLRIDGRTGDDGWILVTTSDGYQGWIAADTIPVALPDNIQIIDLPTTAEAPTQPTRASNNANAYVKANAGGLRLRQLPTTDSAILLNMDANTPLTLLGRNVDSSWVLVEMPEGYQGWTAVAYLDININVGTLDAITNPEPVPLLDLPTPVGAPQVASVGGGGARQIYLRGQQMGNKRNVFTTVGDSLSDTPYFLRHIAYGYNLRDYGYLLPTLQFFNTDTGYGNAYNRRSFSAVASWSSFSVLDANSADQSQCQSGELPINCEYRLVKPSLALIMIGTNDAPAFSADQYRSNMTRIVEISSQSGVIPVLSTLPPRADFNDKIIAYNDVIRQLASAYDVPLWDFFSAVNPLPNHGYSPEDGIHLSLPPGAPASTMDFTSDNLQYGTTMRNLTALQMLKTVLDNVMY